MKKRNLNCFLVFFIAILFIFNKKQNISPLKENELCSTKFDNVTVYHGPTTLNNKARIILKSQYPLYVLQRKKSWIKVIDYKNNIGWILTTNLSNEARAMVIEKIILPNEEIILMPNISAKLIQIQDDSAIIKIKNKKITVPIKSLWIKPINLNKDYKIMN